MFSKTVLLLLALIVLISVADVCANLLSEVPIIGPILETISEMGMETLQIVLVVILTVVAKRE